MLGCVASFALVGGGLSGTAGAASAPVTVQLSVKSHVSLTNNCTQRTAWDLGVVLPGSTQVTDTASGVCSFQFTSNNDSAMVRVSQNDHDGTAMDGDFTGTTWDSLRAPGASLYAVSAVDATHAWAISSGTGVLRLNGAAPWTSSSLGCSGQDISAVSASDAWAVGYSGCIRHWTGASWTTVTVPLVGTQQLISVAVADATHVWVGSTTGSVSFFDGTTWTDVTPTGNTKPINRIRWNRANPNYVYLGLANGPFYRSTTGGTSPAAWTLRTPPNGTNDVDGLAVAPWSGGQDVVWVLTNNNHSVLRSLDGGGTWTNQYTLADFAAGLTDLAVDPTATATATTNLYVTGGERVSWLRSSDGGATWAMTARNAATLNGAVSVSPVGPTTAVAVGAGQLVLATTDGVTWARQAVPAYMPNLRSIAAPTTRTMYAVGGNGTTVKTTDAGATWADPCSPACPITDHLLGVAFADTTHGWEVGDNGRIRATGDGGTTWVDQPAPGGYAGRIDAVTAVDTTTAYASTADGKVFRLDGTNWTDVSPPGVTDELRSVGASDATHVFVAGTGGRLATSADAGATWSSTTVGAVSSFGTVAPIASSPSTALALDIYTRHVWKTTDGVTWNDMGQFMVSNGPQALSTLDGRVVYAAGTYSKLGRTLDGTMAGSSTVVTTGGAPTVLALAQPNAHTVVSVGTGGGIGRKVATAGVADFDASTNNWAGGAGTFGICLQRATGVVADAIPDTFGTANHCDPVDSDPWQGIPAAVPLKLAHTTAAGQTGRVDLVFGARAAPAQAVGTYRATVLFEALAPNA